MPRVPGFLPSTSGLHFSNWFPHVPLITIEILGQQIPIGDAANGLCGGMVFTTRDYFEARTLPPPDTTAPSSGPLFDYVVMRLIDSFNLPHGPLIYVHLMNPALPDHETWLSERGLAPRGRAWVMIENEWPKIKADIDGGHLSPIGLVTVKSPNLSDLCQNHQVMVYGYDLDGTRLTLDIYDPNYPDDDVVTLSLDVADPVHATPVTYSKPMPVLCFFRPGYTFDSPPGSLHEFILFYDRAAGSGEFYTTDGQGNVSLLRKRPGWRNTWAQIIPGHFGKGRFVSRHGHVTDILFYDAAAGEAEFYAMGGQGRWSRLKRHRGWRTTWTHIVPGYFGGSGYTDLLFYDAAAGEAEFCTTDGQGNLSLLEKHQGCRNTWTQIIPGHFGGSGHTDLLFYDATAGEAEFHTTDGRGNVSLLKRHQGWRSTWTHIIPGHFGGSGHTDLLCYDATAGEAEFCTTDGQGNTSLLKQHQGWRNTWAQIIPGYFGGNGYTDLLFYDATAGEIELCTTDGQGNTSLLKRHQGWKNTWTHIVSG